jgi:hypothetical protein
VKSACSPKKTHRFGPGTRGKTFTSGKFASAEKKPAGGELTPAEKRRNRKLGRIRVRVEHALAGVKRCRIVKDVLRNTAEEVSDAVMETAWGLHNFQVERRPRRSKS